MGIMTIFKARSAASKLSKGDTEGAMRLYKEAIDEGLQDVRYILTYVVLLIRAGRYQEARDLLVKIQRYPMADNLRCQLYVDYASCVYCKRGLSFWSASTPSNPAVWCMKRWATFT